MSVQILIRMIVRKYAQTQQGAIDVLVRMGTVVMEKRMEVVALPLIIIQSSPGSNFLWVSAYLQVFVKYNMVEVYIRYLILHIPINIYLFFWWLSK